MKHALIVAVILLLPLAELIAQEQRFTRADTLRGTLLPERKCYDVTFYDLDVRIDPSAQTIAGSNTITFRVDSICSSLQVDLFNDLNVDSMILDGTTSLRFKPEGNAIHVSLGGTLLKGSLHRLRVAYHGSPQVAKNPPWDGGFTWRKDSTGNPWVVVTCQGTGASLWWPNKDHQSDEPDSMRIAISVPPGLEDVSNGRLRAVTPLADGWNKYEWFVSVPINNYDVTINIGKFVHFSDAFVSTVAHDTLTLDYYVLPQSLEKAKVQFKDVNRMLEALERYFGPYPFYKDGYKLIESPHNGMEHQSAIAYGNRFVNGYRGQSSSAPGMKFDFIIVHESAHEWWGNNVTSKDIADMWIHESFGAYAEALFVEYWYGREEAMKYINGKKQNVGNRVRIEGYYNVQSEGSGDMYDKGQLVLNTLRSAIDNDSTWFSILRTIQLRYRYKTVTAESIYTVVNQLSGTDYTPVFKQYLAYASIPQFEAQLRQKGDTLTLRYRWKADVGEFNLPIRVTISKDRFETLHPTTTWQSLILRGIAPEEFRIDEDHFYCLFKRTISYADPRSGR